MDLKKIECIYYHDTKITNYKKIGKDAILYEIDTRLKDVLEDVLRDNDNYEIIFNDVLKQNKKTKKYLKVL